MPTQNNAVVSFEDEPLILVDAEDNVLGHASKQACHDGEGQLHRAFSVFLFDPQGRLLLQQRAPSKRLWPGYWSNSCCSHPRYGESMDAAAARRVREELGLSPALYFLFKFSYHAHYGEIGAEHELCSIYAAVTDQPAMVNANEVAATRWIEPAALDNALSATAADYTPWLALEWPRIRARHWNDVEARLAG